MKRKRTRIWPVVIVVFLLITVISMGSVLANTEGGVSPEGAIAPPAEEAPVTGDLPDAPAEPAPEETPQPEPAESPMPAPTTTGSSPSSPLPTEGVSPLPSASTGVEPSPTGSVSPSPSASTGAEPSPSPSASATPSPEISPEPTPTVYDQPAVFLGEIMAMGSDADLVLTEAQANEIGQYIGEDGTTNIRRAVVEKAYSLAGKVPYFWGGKSTAIGWDARWKNDAIVGSPGSDQTGTTRAYGLDCSGFTLWTMINAFGSNDDAFITGVGWSTADQWNNTYEIAWEDALPGDLVFFHAPNGTDTNHVGVVVGKAADGTVMAAHESSSANNVVISPAQGAGFNFVRRLPRIAEQDSAMMMRSARSGTAVRVSLNGAVQGNYATMADAFSYIKTDNKAGTYAVELLKDYTYTAADDAVFKGVGALAASEVVVTSYSRYALKGTVEINLPENWPSGATKYTFQNIQTDPRTFYANNSPIVMGAGVTVTSGKCSVYGSTKGGAFNRQLSTNVTIKSGNYAIVSGSCPEAAIYDTTANSPLYVKVEGGSVDTLYGGGTRVGKALGDVTVDISGGNVTTLQGTRNTDLSTYSVATNINLSGGTVGAVSVLGNYPGGTLHNRALNVNITGNVSAGTIKRFDLLNIAAGRTLTVTGGIDGKGGAGATYAKLRFNGNSMLMSTVSKPSGAESGLLVTSMEIRGAGNRLRCAKNSPVKIEDTSPISTDGNKLTIGPYSNGGTGSDGDIILRSAGGTAISAEQFIVNFDANLLPSLEDSGRILYLRGPRVRVTHTAPAGGKTEKKFLTMAKAAAHISVENKPGAYEIALLKDYALTSDDANALLGVRSDLNASTVSFTGKPDPAGGVYALTGTVGIALPNQSARPQADKTQFVFTNLKMEGRRISAQGTPVVFDAGFVRTVGDLYVYGGYSNNGSGSTMNGSVTINAGVFYDVYGGSAAGTDGAASTATVTINGGSVTHDLRGANQSAGRGVININTDWATAANIHSFDELNIAAGRQLSMSAVINSTSGKTGAAGVVKFNGGSTLRFTGANSPVAGTFIADGENNALQLHRGATMILNSTAPVSGTGKLRLEYSGATPATDDRVLSFNTAANAKISDYINGFRGQGFILSAVDGSIRLVPRNIEVTAPGNVETLYETMADALSFIKTDNQAGEYTVKLMKDYAYTEQDNNTLKAMAGAAGEAPLNVTRITLADHTLTGAVAMCLPDQIDRTSGKTEFVFRNIQTEPRTFYGQGTPMVFDAGFAYTTNSDQNNVYGGYQNLYGAKTMHCSVTINAGTFNMVTAGGQQIRTTEASTSVVNINGGSIQTLQGEAVVGNLGRSEINVMANVTVSRVYAFDELNIAADVGLTVADAVDYRKLRTTVEGKIRFNGNSTLRHTSTNTLFVGSLTVDGTGNALQLHKGRYIYLFNDAPVDGTGKLTLEYSTGTPAVGDYVVRYSRSEDVKISDFINGFGAEFVLASSHNDIKLMPKNFEVTAPDGTKSFRSSVWDVTRFIKEDNQPGEYTAALLANYTFTGSDNSGLADLTGTAGLNVTRIKITGKPDADGPVYRLNSSIQMRLPDQRALPQASKTGILFDDIIMQANELYAQATPVVFGAGFNPTSRFNIFGGFPTEPGTAYETDVTVNGGNIGDITAGSANNGTSDLSTAADSHFKAVINGGSVTRVCGTSTSVILRSAVTLDVNGGTVGIVSANSGENTDGARIEINVSGGDGMNSLRGLDVASADALSFINSSAVINIKESVSVGTVEGFSALNIYENQTLTVRTLLTDWGIERGMVDNAVTFGLREDGTAGGNATLLLNQNCFASTNRLEVHGNGNRLGVAQPTGIYPTLKTPFVVKGTQPISGGGKLLVYYHQAGAVLKNGDPLLEFHTADNAKVSDYISGFDANWMLYKDNGYIRLGEEQIEVTAPGGAKTIHNSLANAFIFIQADNQPGEYKTALLKDYTYTPDDDAVLSSLTGTAGLNVTRIKITGKPDALARTFKFLSTIDMRLPDQRLVAAKTEFEIADIVWSLPAGQATYKDIIAQGTPLTAGTGVSYDYPPPFPHSIYGGMKVNDGTAFENTITIKDSSWGAVVGGSLEGDDGASRTTVNVDGGIVYVLSGTFARGSLGAADLNINGGMVLTVSGYADPAFLSPVTVNINTDVMTANVMNFDALNIAAGSTLSVSGALQGPGDNPAARTQPTGVVTFAGNAALELDTGAETNVAGRLVVNGTGNKLVLPQWGDGTGAPLDISGSLANGGDGVLRLEYPSGVTPASGDRLVRYTGANAAVLADPEKYDGSALSIPVLKQNAVEAVAGTNKAVSYLHLGYAATVETKTGDVWGAPVSYGSIADAMTAIGTGGGEYRVTVVLDNYVVTPADGLAVATQGGNAARITFTSGSKWVKVGGDLELFPASSTTEYVFDNIQMDYAAPGGKVYANGHPVSFGTAEPGSKGIVLKDKANSPVIFGGSKSTPLTANPSLTFYAGQYGMVYGGGDEAGATVTGSTTVTVIGMDTELDGGYGGGRAADVTGTAVVNVFGGKYRAATGGKVVGGGETGSVGNAVVTVVAGSSVAGDVSIAGADNGTVIGNATLNMSLSEAASGPLGGSVKLNVYGVYGTGSVGGNVDINMNAFNRYKTVSAGGRPGEPNAGTCVIGTKNIYFKSNQGGVQPNAQDIIYFDLLHVGSEGITNLTVTGNLDSDPGATSGTRTGTLRITNNSVFDLNNGAADARNVGNIATDGIAGGDRSHFHVRKTAAGSQPMTVDNLNSSGADGGNLIQLVLGLIAEAPPASGDEILVFHTPANAQPAQYASDYSGFEVYVKDGNAIALGRTGDLNMEQISVRNTSAAETPGSPVGVNKEITLLFDARVDGGTPGADIVSAYISTDWAPDVAWSGGGTVPVGDTEMTLTAGSGAEEHTWTGTATMDIVPPALVDPQYYFIHVRNADGRVKTDILDLHGPVHTPDSDISVSREPDGSTVVNIKVSDFRPPSRPAGVPFSINYQGHGVRQIGWSFTENDAAGILPDMKTAPVPLLGVTDVTGVDNYASYTAKISLAAGSFTSTDVLYVYVQDSLGNAKRLSIPMADRVIDVTVPLKVSTVALKGHLYDGMTNRLVAPTCYITNNSSITLSIEMVSYTAGTGPLKLVDKTSGFANDEINLRVKPAGATVWTPRPVVGISQADRVHLGVLAPPVGEAKQRIGFTFDALYDHINITDTSDWSTCALGYRFSQVGP